MDQQIPTESERVKEESIHKHPSIKKIITNIEVLVFIFIQYTVNGILHNAEGKSNFHARNDGYTKSSYYKTISNTGSFNG